MIIVIFTSRNSVIEELWWLTVPSELILGRV